MDISTRQTTSMFASTKLLNAHRPTGGEYPGPLTALLPLNHFLSSTPLYFSSLSPHFGERLSQAHCRQEGSDFWPLKYWDSHELIMEDLLEKSKIPVCSTTTCRHLTGVPVCFAS
ncbi:hypothetical protein HCEG_00618 [Histoplasma capsulatum var. duboisii H88]|uniref:Uncharacterized protein n=2 Tax=Ajellomyces capsulatus TaxID=5037 RepID=F0U555_AJEC8|nr:hypothetical protein HCDG_00887 [Histoplasma capsulatum H143]EGC41256.1 hypothetical protein HCEG_00618 [Histoplasma capsulatum var. duboisii H88]